MTSKPYYDPDRKEIHGVEASGAIEDPRGIGAFIFDAMKKFSKENRIAQIIAETGYEDPFSSLLSRCIRVALAMRNLGIKKGDIITICSPHHVNTVVPLVAGYFLGVITSATDPTLSLEETKYLLNLVKPKFIFASPCCEALMMNALEGAGFTSGLAIFGHTKINKSFEWFLEQGKGEEDTFEPVIQSDLSSTCLIMFSSGTTGLPKGICLTQKYLMRSIYGLSNLGTPCKTYLGYATLYWGSAVIIGTSCLGIGTRRLLCQSFQPDLVCEYIHKYQVDYIFIAPIQAIKTIPHLTAKGNTVKYIMIAGSKIAPNYLQQLREGLPDPIIASLYGQTEVGYIAQFTEKDHNYAKLESGGLPMPGLIMKVADPDTEQRLPLTQVGEIRVKTTSGISGYYNVDSSGIWDAEGFIKTGDLGYFDDDLCLFVTDRIKEMFKYQSWHIVPAELEAVLQSHPDVDLAIVIGIPHPIDDNHALGVVTLRTDAEATKDDIERFVDERTNERHKLRAGIMILDGNKLPFTPTGKINRRLIKKIVEDKLSH